MGPPLAYDLKFKIIDPSSDMGDQYEIISDVNVSTSNKNQDQSVLKSSENGFIYHSGIIKYHACRVWFWWQFNRRSICK